MPFKAQADRRHHSPKPRHRVTNRSEYDAALRQRGRLTIGFSDEASAGGPAAPRTTPGGPPSSSDLAITPALTLRAVVRLAWRQTEGLSGALLPRLGLDRAGPDHATWSRRAETLPVPRPRSGSGSEPLHWLVDSTGRRLGGPGAWLVETHGSQARRSWRKLPRGGDADTGRIVAAALTDKAVDDGAPVGPLLDPSDGPGASFTAAGAFARDDGYNAVAARPPAAAVVVPPRAGAVPSDPATAPTQRERHLAVIAARGRRGWQKGSGDNWRALIEAEIGRCKRVIGATLRSPTDGRQGTEMALAVRALNRLLELGRPEYVRIA